MLLTDASSETEEHLGFPKCIITNKLNFNNKQIKRNIKKKLRRRDHMKMIKGEDEFKKWEGYLLFLLLRRRRF